MSRCRLRCRAVVYSYEWNVQQLGSSEKYKKCSVSPSFAPLLTLDSEKTDQYHYLKCPARSLAATSSSVFDMNPGTDAATALRAWYLETASVLVPVAAVADAAVA